MPHLRVKGFCHLHTTSKLPHWRKQTCCSLRLNFLFLLQLSKGGTSYSFCSPLHSDCSVDIVIRCLICSCFPCCHCHILRDKGEITTVAEREATPGGESGSVHVALRKCCRLLSVYPLVNKKAYRIQSQRAPNAEGQDGVTWSAGDQSRVRQPLHLAFPCWAMQFSNAGYNLGCPIKKLL